MDWDLAIKSNRAALLRIVAALFDLVGLNADDGTSSDLERLPWPATLPRHLYRAALLVLGPAESALRRLIIVAARDVVVVLSSAERERIAQAALTVPAQPSKTGIFLRGRLAGPEELNCVSRPRTVDGRPRAPSFALFDPLKRFGLSRRRPLQSIPRILFNLESSASPDLPARRVASPDDPVGAARLCLRLAALKGALDDLPGQARRLARWRARRVLRVGRVRRLSPLRPGLPPGHRQRPVDEVDTVLRHCHGLAIESTLSPNTS